MSHAPSLLEGEWKSRESLPPASSTHQLSRTFYPPWRNKTHPSITLCTKLQQPDLNQNCSTEQNMECCQQLVMLQKYKYWKLKLSGLFFSIIIWRVIWPRDSFSSPPQLNILRHYYLICLFFNLPPPKNSVTQEHSPSDALPSVEP